jgi:DNA-binding NtrC family response regulator
MLKMIADSHDKEKHEMSRILVIDDDEMTLKNMRRILEKLGYQVSTFSNPLRALERLEKSPYDVIISDFRMPYLDGLELLNRAKRLSPAVEVILVTGYASIEGAIEATKQGAFHYLAKPFDPEQVRMIVCKALETKSFKAHGQASANRYANALLIGKSSKIREVHDMVGQIAPTECNVLVTGESGTGKELVARSIHTQSPRSKGPFVAFNCGAFSEDLIANELFGHEKEAFTGALTSRAGLLETANTGTLFMDEIGDMPLSMQLKLLRVIQEREVTRVGGTRPVRLDVRIIAATARDLKVAVSEEAFRQDLYYRLNVVNIVLPKLTDRKEDIPLLAYHILERLKKQMKKPIRGLSCQAMDLLQRYAYPGNVRELENILERAVAIAKGELIQVWDLPPDIEGLELYSYDRSDGGLLNLDELERDYIAHVLKLNGGSRTKTAQILGIDRASLWRKMKKHSLD